MFVYYIEFSNLGQKAASPAKPKRKIKEIQFDSRLPLLEITLEKSPPDTFIEILKL